MTEPIKAEVFTHHSADCKYKNQRYYRKCSCRKWIYVSGTRQRISAKTRSWEKAEEKRKQIEQGESAEPEREGADADDAIAKVVADFLEMKKSKVCSDLYGKYKRDLEDFTAWCATRYDRPIIRLAEIENVRPLQKYQNTWSGAAITKNSRFARFRAFFNYAVLHKLLAENHAQGLTKFRTVPNPTMPLEPKDFERLMATIDRYHSRARGGDFYRQRIRAMLLLLRWSGLRISDAARLERSKIDRKTNKLHLYTAKAGTPINVPLPPELVAMLFALPNVNEKYFFWTGKSTAESPGKRWAFVIQKLAQLAGIKARAHMLRDTFAVEALKSRQLTLEQVSKILGHSSVKITEKHYLPWIPALQEQLEAGVRAMWPTSILTPTTTNTLTVN